MRLESRKCVGNGSARLQSLRSSSIDSNDEDNRIRLDDPSLRLSIDSPHLQTEPTEPNFNEPFPPVGDSNKKENDRNVNNNITEHTAVQQNAAPKF